MLRLTNVYYLRANSIKSFGGDPAGESGGGGEEERPVPKSQRTSRRDPESPGKGKVKEKKDSIKRFHY